MEATTTAKGSEIMIASEATETMAKFLWRDENGRMFDNEEFDRLMVTWFTHSWSMENADRATWDIDEEDQGSWFDSLHVELQAKEEGECEGTDCCHACEDGRHNDCGYCTKLSSYTNQEGR